MHKAFKTLIGVPLMFYLIVIISMQGTTYKEFMLQYCAVSNPRWNDEVFFIMFFITAPTVIVMFLILNRFFND